MPAADILDDQDASGFIALQVHSVHKENLAGKQVAWRGIRILTTNLESEKSPGSVLYSIIVFLIPYPNKSRQRDGNFCGMARLQMDG